MKNFIRIFNIILLSLMLTACGEPTLDTSSDEALQQSLKEMTKDLSKKDKKEFQQALTGVYMAMSLS